MTKGLTWHEDHLLDSFWWMVDCFPGIDDFGRDHQISAYDMIWTRRENASDISPARVCSITKKRVFGIDKKHIANRLAAQNGKVATSKKKPHRMGSGNWPGRLQKPPSLSCCSCTPFWKGGMEICNAEGLLGTAQGSITRPILARPNWQKWEKHKNSWCIFATLLPAVQAKAAKAAKVPFHIGVAS